MEGNRRHQLGVAASSGGGGETRSQEHLCGAVTSGGGGENGGQEPLRGSIVGGRPAQSVDASCGGCCVRGWGDTVCTQAKAGQTQRLKEQTEAYERRRAYM
ncbi:hypothetical protein PI125_g4547 [Phytophthora idaei]|nr:hypothetical protein PI125_g4547 [Phytophthora idaei]